MCIPEVDDAHDAVAEFLWDQRLDGVAVRLRRLLYRR